MHDLIRCVAAWLRRLFVPGTGKRRAGSRQPPASPVRRSDPPRPAAAQPPVARSPYGLHEHLDGEAAAMVRPYVIAMEQERAHRRRRRIALVLATDFGIDLDQLVTGSEAMA
nr:hypothetical protein [Streptomyces sp. NRRL S-31]